MVSALSALRGSGPVEAIRPVARPGERTPTDQPTDARGKDRYEAAPQDGLTPAELQLVSKLQSRDREVRAHEAAHQAASGGGAGAASFTTQTGPDGKQYAIGGEVPIDTSPVQGDPAATIAKMRQVRAAALAPANPSGQDMAVAAAASAMAAEAQQELTRVALEARQGGQPASGAKPRAGTDPATGSKARAAYARAAATA